MATTNYHTVDGVILGQTVSGGRTQYLTDALGSVTCTVADDGQTQNTYRYKPYGGQLAKTGVATDPKYGWVGRVGYRRLGVTMPSHYVRARQYSESLGTWISVDPLWPSIPAYGYSASSPSNFADPSGYKVVGGDCFCMDCINGKCKEIPNKPFEVPIKSACADIKRCYENLKCRQAVIDCLRRGGLTAPDPASMFKCIYEYCTTDLRSATVVCVFDFCWSPLVGDLCGYTWPGKPCQIRICFSGKKNPCPGWKCPIDACPCYEPTCDAAVNIMHELTHCCGMGAFFADKGDLFVDCMSQQP